MGIRPWQVERRIFVYEEVNSVRESHAQKKMWVHVATKYWQNYQIHVEKIKNYEQI